MIKLRTVLILGAGASKPYCFPTGRELLIKIRKALDPKGTSDLRSNLVNFGIDDNHINDFHRELMYSDPPSVDAFLEHRTEFLKVGKLAITLSLIPCEKDKTLFERELKEPSWYQYLFERLYTPSLDDFRWNKLSIITFNYDRSIEHYLFSVLKHRYGISEEECKEKMKIIPILHVHGRIGALPWQEESARLYSPKVHRNVKKVSEQIKVVTGDLEPSPEFTLAYTWMDIAEKIVFLGFGYHEANLRRLRIDEFKRKSMSGTCQGLGKSDIRIIGSKWNIQFFEETPEIIKFLRDREPLI